MKKKRGKEEKITIKTKIESEGWCVRRRERGREVVMIPALRDLAHPLAYWLAWSTAFKLAEV